MYFLSWTSWRRAASLMLRIEYGMEGLEVLSMAWMWQDRDRTR